MTRDDDATRTNIDLAEDLLAEITRTEAKRPASLDEELKNCDILEAEGFVEESKKILRKILRQDPNCVAAQIRLEKIHQAELDVLFGKRSNIQNFEKEKEKKPEIVDPQMVDRILYRLEDDFELNSQVESFDFNSTANEIPELTQHLVQGIETSYPELSDQDRTDLAIAFIEMGFGNATLEILKHVKNESISSWFITVLAHLSLGKPFEAMLKLEEILGKTELPQEERVHFFYLMGRTKEHLHKNDEARAWFEAVVGDDPHYRDALERLGQLKR